MKNRKTMLPRATNASANPIIEIGFRSNSRHFEVPPASFGTPVGSSAMVRFSPLRVLTLVLTHYHRLGTNCASREKTIINKNLASRPESRVSRRKSDRLSRFALRFLGRAVLRRLAEFCYVHALQSLFFPGGFEKGYSIEFVLFAVMFERHLSVPPCPVHWVNIRIKEDLIKVPYHDGQ